jgi:hypothetical protein
VSDNADLPATGIKAATDAVTYSGDAAHVQLMRLVDVAGAEGSKSVTALVLPVSAAAGENHIGAVGGNSAVVGGTFNRPADTNLYAIGDLVANSTTAGSVAPIACAAARVNAGTGVIRRVRLSTNHTGLLGTEVFRVRLFKTSPTVTVGDNGVLNAGGSSALAVNGVGALSLGYVDVTLSEIFNDGSKGYAAADILFDAASGSQNIYALIEARSSYTPASGETFALALEVYQD